MKEQVLHTDFDVDDITERIISQISEWRCSSISLNDFKWEIIDHDGNSVYRYFFKIDFEDVEGRIKMEDLRLNIIHFIESLKDDTEYSYKY